MTYLDEVKLWSEEEVGEWLKLNDFEMYIQVFCGLDNNINGDILLDCDATLLRELGIDEPSHRIKLLVCIKKLREKCFASARKAKRSFFLCSPKIPKSFTSISRQSSVDPLISEKIYDSSISPSFQLDQHSYDTCIRNSSSTHSSSMSDISSKMQNPRKSSSVDGLKVFEKSPLTFPELNIVQKQNDCDIPVSQNDKSVQLGECICNDIFLSISSQQLKPKEEKLVTDTDNSLLIPEGINTSQVIAKEQYDLIYHTTIMAKTTGNLRKLETFFGEKFSQPVTSPVISLLPSPSHKDNKSGSTKRIKNFFGQRPPSELISSNLTEYFPGHEKKMLEQTVRNSIRRSSHLNATRRSSFNVPNSNTFIYDVSSIPTPGEAWIQFEGRKLSKNGRRFSLSYFVSTQFSTLLETSPKENIPKSSLSSPKSYIESSVSILKSESDTENDILDIKSNSHNRVKDKQPSIRASKSESCVLDQSLTLSPSCDIDSEITRNDLDDNIFENNEIKDFNIENGMENNNSGPTRWIKGALIGSGSFGSVFLGMNALSGELMAVKQVEIPSYDIQGCKRKLTMLDALQREISLLKELHHENIVQYLGSSMDETHLTFFLEYVPGGSVTALLNSYGAFEEPLIRNFVRQILKGLNYLHNKKIIHRDIKGANILVDNKGVIKISDFGISKKVEANLLSISKNHRPSLQGSVYWMAPEVVKQTLYTRKADIWSLGCLVVEMFTGEHPFPKMNQLQAIFKIGQYVSPEIPEHCTLEARQFLEKTFEPDYHTRPTAADLLKCNFLEPMVSNPLCFTKK
ncbi:hypothetical protein PCK1_001107 [Pneumocystis canis]|nr:hypothetical protein PCK1_001107 [Pneumocystis canis]